MNILLVDDHTLFRNGLRCLLAAIDDSLRVTEAASCEQAIALLGASRPDIVLLDLKMPGRNGIDSIGIIRDAIAGVPMVVLSGEDQPRTIRAAIDAGAMGFIPKVATPDILIYALRIVLAGGVYIPAQALASDEVSGLGGMDATTLASQLRSLTDRQMAVLRLVIQGEPNKVIARQLAIAEGTVKAHLSAVLRALGVRNRTEAVFAAARLGLQMNEGTPKAIA